MNLLLSISAHSGPKRGLRFSICSRQDISQHKRKLNERVFGWAKLDRPLRQIKRRGLPRADWFYRLMITAHSLVRLQRLLLPPVQVDYGGVFPGARKSLPETPKAKKKPLWVPQNHA